MMEIKTASQASMKFLYRTKVNLTKLDLMEFGVLQADLAACYDLAGKKLRELIDREILKQFNQSE